MDYKEILTKIKNKEDFDINEETIKIINDDCYAKRSVLVYLYDLQLEGNADIDLQYVIEYLEKQKAICIECVQQDFDDEIHFDHISNKCEYLQSRAIEAIQAGDVEKLQRIINSGLDMEQKLSLHRSYMEQDGVGKHIRIAEAQNLEIEECSAHPLLYAVSRTGVSEEKRKQMIRFLGTSCTTITEEDINAISEAFEAICKPTKELREVFEQEIALMVKKTKSKEKKHTPKEIAEGIEPTQEGINKMVKEMIDTKTVEKKGQSNEAPDEI